MTLEELLALVEQAEGDLSALSVEQLSELRDQLYAGFVEVRPSVVDDEGVNALTRVAQAIASVDLAIEAGAEGEAESTQSVTDALAALDAAVLMRDEDVPPIVGGTEGGTDGEVHPAGVPPTSHPVEGVEAEEEPEAEEVKPKAKAKSARTTRPSLTSLARTVPAEVVVADESAPIRILASANGVPGVAGGAEMSLEQLGATFERQHRAMQTIPSWKQLDPESVTMSEDGSYHGVGGAKHYIGEVPITPKPGVVALGQNGGSECIDEAVRQFVQARDERDRHNARMLASGGNCVLALPDYSIKVVGAGGTCFTDNLPTVSGPRPMTYYPWLEIDQSTGATGRGTIPLGGIGFVTEAQDRAGYGDPTIAAISGVPQPGGVPIGGAPYKSCIHIDCPASPLTCDLEAVYKCVTIGNFQAASHPEYVAAWQKYMDIWFDIERDNRALDKYVAQAVANSHVIRMDEMVFGAVGSLKDVLNRFVAHERSSHHDNSLSFNVVAPDWFGGFLTEDILRHTFGTVENLRATPAEAMSLASTDGIRVSTYCTQPGVTSGAAAQDMVLAPIGSTIPAWPNRARLLIFPDGAVFKKTGASLSFGLRETLLRSNDFGMFMELMENVCFRTGRVWVLDIKLCPNGATGAPVALTCT